MKVLIVDDEEDVADIVTIYFTTVGHQCQPSYSAKMALVVAEVWKPNLVVLDVGLKDRCGLDIVDELRPLCAPGAVIVGVSGWGTKKDIERAFDAGVDNYFVKPFHRPDITKMIEMATDRMAMVKVE